MSEYTIVTAREAERFRELSAGVQTASRPVFLDHDFDHLIAPVRPSMKSRYPLIPMADYCRWHNTHGEPFDPWLRVHVRAGGQVVHPCLRAMAVSGTRQQWSAWTGMDFPGDGSYVVPHALVPVTVRGAEGCYVEPGIWVVHGLREESA